MLSVVIATRDSERALVPTLAALVPGVVAGMVREVIVADAGSRDATVEIADGAGCRVLALAARERGTLLKAAADSARAPWLLFLEPGAVPDVTWIEETSRFVDEAGHGGSANHHAAVFRPGSKALRPQLRDALLIMWSAIGTRPTARQGLLIAKAHYEALGGHRNVPDPQRELIRRVGRRHIVQLGTSVTTRA
jgi:hypothetical protein